MNKTAKGILYIVLIIAVVACALYMTKGFGLWKNAGSGIEKNKYQAVFLSNGQVYFGKLNMTGNKTATLDDIYYLQVEQVQPKTDETTSNNKLTLIKLGNEIHSPEDKMYINTDQILFIENLKDEGKVAQAIKKYQTEGATTTNAAATTSALPQVQATQ